jgi:hypothetical protein
MRFHVLATGMENGMEGEWQSYSDGEEKAIPTTKWEDGEIKD